jgi:hypothetical protein
VGAVTGIDRVGQPVLDAAVHEPPQAGPIEAPSQQPIVASYEGMRHVVPHQSLTGQRVAGKPFAQGLVVIGVGGSGQRPERRIHLDHGLSSEAARANVENHQFPDTIRLLRRHEQRDGTPHRVAYEMRSTDLELVQNGDNIGGHRRGRVVARPIALAVTALVERSHGEIRSERAGQRVPLADVPHDPVQHNNRWRSLVTRGAVVELQVTDGGPPVGDGARGVCSWSHDQR